MPAFKPSSPQPAVAAAPNPWTLPLGRVAGIPLRLHLTFLLLLALPIFFGSGLSGAYFLLAVFGCVLLHELGHALAARRFGIPVREIVLYPIGGVARLESVPTPKQELWVTAAGPAVNVVLAAALFSWLAATGQAANVLQPGASSFAERLLWANVALLAFNLIPAFPLDGGRIMRAALALRIGEAPATRLAARIGQLLAVIIGVAGLFSNPFLLVIAFLVFTGAGQEAAFAEQKTLVEGLPAREAMVTDLRTLPHGATLGEATGALLATSQSEFPVVHNETVVGVLTRRALMEGLTRHGTGGYVAGVMDRDFAVVSPDDDLALLLSGGDNVLARSPHLLVVQDEHGRLAGLVTPENLAELLLVRRAAEQRLPRAA